MTVSSIRWSLEEVERALRSRSSAAAKDEPPWPGLVRAPVGVALVAGAQATGLCVLGFEAFRQLPKGALQPVQELSLDRTHFQDDAAFAAAALALFGRTEAAPLWFEFVTEPRLVPADQR